VALFRGITEGGIPRDKEDPPFFIIREGTNKFEEVLSIIVEADLEDRGNVKSIGIVARAEEMRNFRRVGAGIRVGVGGGGGLGLSRFRRYNKVAD